MNINLVKPQANSGSKVQKAWAQVVLWENWSELTDGFTGRKLKDIQEILDLVLLPWVPRVSSGKWPGHQESRRFPEGLFFVSGSTCFI